MTLDADTRIPAYLSCARLARELDVVESTVYELVRRGVLPKPVKLGGSVRWRWADVDLAIGSMQAGAPAGDTDPFMKGAIDATATQ